MKTKLLSLLFVLCLILSLCVLPVSASSLKVGVSVEKTLYKSITTESPLELGRIDQPDPANGLSITAVKNSDTSLSIYYEGTPTLAGVSYFAVSYTVDGIPIGEYGSLSVEKASASSTEMPATPIITSSSPSSDISCLTTDSNLYFSVSALANGTLSYRWLLDGSDLSVNGNTMTLTPSSLTAGSYRVYCEITNSLNGYAQVTDTSWLLTVNNATEKPTITSSVSAAEITGTGSARFTVQASGQQLSYQWYESGVSAPLSDGSFGTLTISGSNTETLKVSCSGSTEPLTKKYYCIITDGSDNSVSSGLYTLYISEDASLSVVKEISIASLPTKLVYQVGETLDLSGMTLSAISGKGAETVSTGFACEPMLLQKEGTQTILVSYSGKTTTFEVSVIQASHSHQWTAWMVDNEHNMVSRTCLVDNCTAKEIYSELAFLQEYPEEAEKLGIKTSIDNSSSENDSQEKTDQSMLDAASSTDTSDENSTKKNALSGTQRIFLAAIVIAAILLIIAIGLYYRLYGKKSTARNKQNK